MRRGLPGLVAALLGALAMCWVLLTPPGAAADEPSHLFRVGAVAGGDLGELFARTLDPPEHLRHLPPEYSIPEPGCYAQQPWVPVDCAVGTDRRPLEPDGTVAVITTADNYPIWGHVIPAVATWLPGDGGIWAARTAGAASAIVLVTASLVVAARRGAGLVAAIFVALTPMAWSMFATVNPSALATAGAVALWTALVARRPGWLLAAGWAAAALPRRDGLVWACLVVALAVIVAGRDVVEDVWRLRRRLVGPLTVVGATTAFSMLWSLTSPARVNQMGALGPVAVVAAWSLRWSWDRLDGRRAARASLAAGTGAAALVAVAVSAVVRPGGWNADLTRAIVGETRRHLTEAIGVLGWLDAPLPRWSVIAWVALVGVLAWLAAGARAWQGLALAAATLVTAVVTAWMFELQEGSTYGRYWQGRYSLPLLVGVPLALGAAVRVGRRATVGLIAAALFLLNVAAWAATRRWAVGIGGTHRPWKWGAELVPVHPLPLLVVHAGASVALVWAVARLTRGHEAPA